jgi:hypothetical protein
MNRIRTRTGHCALLLFLCLISAGCANLGGGIGLSLPIGGFGSVGINFGSDGRVGASLGVGHSGLSVGVGTSVQLPSAKTTGDASKDAK